MMKTQTLLMIITLGNMATLKSITATIATKNDDTDDNDDDDNNDDDDV